MSYVFQVAVGKMPIHMDSIARKVRRMSLVDSANINQDGGTSATFHMNDKVEGKENLDVF